jgi:hypothetical protein
MLGVLKLKEHEQKMRVNTKSTYLATVEKEARRHIVHCAETAWAIS